MGHSLIIYGISGPWAWVTVIRALRDDNTTLRQTPAPARSADLKSQPQGRPDDQQIEQQQGVFLRASRTSAEVSLPTCLTTLPPRPPAPGARARVSRAGLVTVRNTEAKPTAPAIVNVIPITDHDISSRYIRTRMDELDPGLVQRVGRKVSAIVERYLLND